MSYINLSVTSHFTGGDLAAVLPRSEKISAGFSREGGKVEFVQQAEQSDPLATPRTYDARLTGSVTRAAEGARDAAQAAGWVQDVEIWHGGDSSPASVNWTFRNGGEGSGVAGSLPAPVQAVIDAAAHLSDVTTAQLVYDGS